MLALVYLSWLLSKHPKQGSKCLASALISSHTREAEASSLRQLRKKTRECWKLQIRREKMQKERGGKRYWRILCTEASKCSLIAKRQTPKNAISHSRVVVDVRVFLFPLLSGAAWVHLKFTYCTDLWFGGTVFHTFFYAFAENWLVLYILVHTYIYVGTHLNTPILCVRLRARCARVG